MPNTFSGRGNLVASPSVKFVPVKGEHRAVAEMEVFFDEFKRDARGELQRHGGFFMKVSLWGEKGEAAARLLRKGARVKVDGRLTQSTYAHKETGIEMKSYEVTAEDVFMALTRVDSVQFAEKRGTNTSVAAEELEHGDADSNHDPLAA